MRIIGGNLASRVRGRIAAISLALTLGLSGTLTAATLDVTHATIPEIQAAYATGRLTAEKVTAAYLARIAPMTRLGRPSMPSSI